MGPSAVFNLIVIMAVGGYLGWHVRSAYGLHSDMKTYKSRIPRFRAARNRSGVISVVVLVLTFFVVRALLM